MTTPLPDIPYDYEHFTLDKLERILPVAQTQQIGEMDFTLLALECYEAGFVATALIEQDRRAPDPLPPRDEMGTPLILRGLLLFSEVEDDLGNAYIGHMRAGSGGGGGDGPLRTHMVYGFAPALAATARTLTVTLTQVERPRYDSDGRPTWNDDQVVTGPWTLSFPLDAPSEPDTAPVDVLPVAERISVEDVSVTVTTLERHTWGLVVNSRVDWPSADGPFPRPVWRASDDQGRSYGTGNCAGGGNIGGDNTNTWRMYCRFQPLDPAASELRLQLTSLGLRRAVRSEEEDRFDHWDQTREVTNLGEITVALPAQTG